VNVLVAPKTVPRSSGEKVGMAGFAGNGTVLADQGKSGCVMIERTVGANFFPVVDVVAVGAGNIDRPMGRILSLSLNGKEQNQEYGYSYLKPVLQFYIFAKHKSKIHNMKKEIGSYRWKRNF
jgi:hypothetical protein